MSSTWIIAEAGVNHNGSLDRAKEMIKVAAAAGVDAVKFQTFSAENLVTQTAIKASYQLQNTGVQESQFEMLKKLEFTFDEYLKLQNFCQKIGVTFLSSPFDLASIDFLSKIGLNLWKIPSGEITNLPYLRAIGKRGEQVILSTGMCELHEIREAIHVLVDSGMKLSDLRLLHCNTEYPTPMPDVNLRSMLTMQDEFRVQVGYSDHTLGIEVSIAAVALGAVIIEKHFTLDRKLPGPDHQASLEPSELRAMVSAIRNVEICLGDGNKRPSPSEIQNIPIARKSIVAAKPISVGEIFTPNNLTTKRPGTGISPMRWDSLIGQKANRDYEKDDFIEA